MKKYKRTTVTAALPYANGGVHIGHLAGVYVPADIYVRYLRLKGRDVKFICGSDEHGVPITIRAKKEGLTPQQVVDRYHNLIENSFKEFGISFDIYGRTTSKTHHKTASEFFKRLYDEGKLIEKETEQYYDVEAEQFLADRYITGECPRCHNLHAYGDQCEQCGSELDPTELINPKSVISGTRPIRKKTTNWYLPLNQYQKWLQEWILEGHKEWRSNVYGQCKSWLDAGLQPRAMTRDLNWGIPVPLEKAGDKVLYVWFDAPIGYISNTKDLLGDAWEKWWKDPETRLIHFIGKDNIVFHCIVFPVMLKAHGGYILPDNVPANEFLNLENGKISTSQNRAVWLSDYLLDFPGKQDALRYTLTANAPETKDNNFTWSDFQDRNNNELVSIYGNFANRALQLTKRYFSGVVPQPDVMQDIDLQAINQIKQTQQKIEELIENFHFRDAQREAMNLARVGNKYITEGQPWAIWKTDPQRVRTILYVSLQIVAGLALIFEPFLPTSSKKLRDMLNLKDCQWDSVKDGNVLSVGHKLNEPGLLFEKIEDEKIELQLEKLAKIKQETQVDSSKIEPIKAAIDYETFDKVDIRTATIVNAEKVEKTEKLLKFTLDDGSGVPRTIVSGIAKHYDIQTLIGKQILFVANLAPRKLMGIVSQGMILTAEQPDGTLSLATTEAKTLPGSKVR